MTPTLTADACRRLTPLIRAQFQEEIFGSSARVAAVSEDSVLSGRLRRGASLIHVADSQTLKQHLKRVKEVPFAELTSVMVRKGGRRTRLVTLQIRSPKRSLKLRLPYDQAEHFLALLQHHMPDRLTLGRTVPLHGWGLNLFLLLTVGLAVTSLLMAESSLAAVIVFAFAVAPLLLVQIYDHFPAPFPWAESERPRKRAKDRSGVEPFRSKRLGWALKIASVLVLVLLWSVGLTLLAPIALVLLYIGNQIASVPPRLVRESDRRAPILYLRSFLDDRKSNLTPDTRYSIALGVMPPRFLPTPWRYLFYLHPVRVLRILFGISVDTSEEQLALFFRKLGPFVAIGKPGERFASPGAARMYVTNEDWQNIVLEHLRTSQVVLLQPANTEGIWWEVEKTLALVAPQKVLLCMVNFHHRQNDYEKFRLRAEQFLKHPLPRNLAYTKTAAFMYFDENWHPFVQQVSCRVPMIWPIVGNPVDLKYTLEPFLRSAAILQAADATEAASANHQPASEESGHPAQPQVGQQPVTAEHKVATLLPSMLPRPPRGVSRGAQFSANLVYLGAILMLPMVPLLFAGVEGARNAARGAAAEAANAEQLAAGGQTEEAAALKQQAVAFYKEGELDRAWAALNQSIEINDTDPQAFLYRGDVLESLQRREEAIDDYQRALNLDPNDPLAWNNLGYACLQLSRFEEAIEYFSKAIELDDQNSSFFTNRGLAALRADQPDQAIADFTHSLQINPQQASLYDLQGQALAQQEQWIEAIRYFNTAIQLEPNVAEFYFRRGRAFVAIGDQKSEELNPYEYARQNFDEYLKRSPETPRVLLDRAEVNRLDGRLDDAIADLTRFLELVPGDEVALEQRLNVSYEAGKHAAAIADAKALIQKNPDAPDKKVLLASLLFLLERYPEAIAVADAVIAEHPDDVAAHRVRGNCFYRQLHYKDALESYGHALKILPQDGVSLANRAQIFAMQNRYELCAAEYRKLVDIQPEQFDPRYFLSYALAASKQWEQLDATRSSLVNSFAASPSGQIQMLTTRLGLLGPEVGSYDGAAALNLVKSLHEANPQNWDIGLLHGAMELRVGQLAEAESLLQAVMEQAADPRIIASTQIWLSQAQARLGKTEEARNTLDAAGLWVTQHCSLDIEQEQAGGASPADQAGVLEWWQRVEIQDWLSLARTVLQTQTDQ